MEQREGQSKPTKVPYNFRSGCKASSTEPRDWGTFEDVQNVLAVYGPSTDGHMYDGAGFVFTRNDPYTGIDLDGAYEAPGCLYVWAQRIVDTMGSYAERSPSGTGVHIFVRATLAPGRRRQGGVEVYDQGRFFTVTGEHLTGTPTTIEAAQRHVNELVSCMGPVVHQQAVPIWGQAIPPGDLRQRAASGRIRRETLALLDSTGPDRYGSASEADAALAGGLASSGLMADEILRLIEGSVRGYDAYKRKGNNHGLYYWRRTVEGAVRMVGPVIVRDNVRYQASGTR